MQQASTESAADRFWLAVGGLKLPGKLALAVVSGFSYWWIGDIKDDLGWFDWSWHLIGAIFGALVMAPYVAASNYRLLRALAMCIASATIYHYTIVLVSDGPFSVDTNTPWLVFGGSAALLTGLSTWVLAPLKFHLTLIPLTLVAGALGGGAYHWIPLSGDDPKLSVVHFAWQVLVCLALHFGLRPAVK